MVSLWIITPALTSVSFGIILPGIILAPAPIKQSLPTLTLPQIIVPGAIWVWLPISQSWSNITPVLTILFSVPCSISSSGSVPWLTILLIHLLRLFYLWYKVYILWYFQKIN